MLATTILKTQKNDMISIIFRKIKYLLIFLCSIQLPKVVFQTKLSISYLQVQVLEKVWQCVTLLLPISPLDKMCFISPWKWQKKGLLNESTQIYLMCRLINLRVYLSNFLIPKLTNSNRKLEENLLLRNIQPQQLMLDISERY